MFLWKNITRCLSNLFLCLLQKQQLLQDEYKRGTEEDQRLAAELARTAGGPDLYERQKHLGEERRREYQDFLAQVRNQPYHEKVCLCHMQTTKISTQSDQHLCCLLP